MRTERMAEDADWKDGMNVFRLQVRESLTAINQELKKIKQIIKGESQ